MRRIVIAALCAAALVVIPAAPPAAAMSNKTFDAKLTKYTNEARKDHDRKVLKFGSCLDRYAQRQANRMADQKRMFHQNLSVVLAKCKARAVAENVAHGFTSPKANVRAWLKSPGHRRNMLSKTYTRLGIGVAKDEDGHSYTVQVFGRPA